MPWRHPGSCVNDLVPKIGFNPEDVKKLGEFVVKLRNIPMGVLVILGLSKAWWNHRCDPVIREGNNGSEVQAEAHGLSCVIQERIPNNTTLLDAPRIVIPTPRATRVIDIYDSLCMLEIAIPDRAPEQLEVTLSGEKVLVRVEATRKRKASTAVGISTKSSHRNRPIRRSSRADSSLRQLSNDGSEQEDQASESRVAKGGNVGGQAMPPPQEIHTGFDPRGFGANDLGNQVADDAPLNGNDYEIDGGNDHSHDGGHPIDVENHEEPEQASSVPNDTSDRIERDIASSAHSPYYLLYPFEEGERFNAAIYLGRSRRSIMIQGLNDDQLMDRVNVLHCQKMIHEGELVARFWGLLRQYEDLRTSNRVRNAYMKEKSKGRKKLVRCQEKTIGKLTTECTRLKKELHDAHRAAEKKSD
ncbi:hypothetical protein Tco_0986294 [Tanacetum coccineum]